MKHIQFGGRDRDHVKNVPIQNSALRSEVGKEVWERRLVPTMTKSRPVKIYLKSLNIAKVLLYSRSKLKDILVKLLRFTFNQIKPNQKGTNLLNLKKKQELMERHPTAVGDDPRVVLKN